MLDPHAGESSLVSALRQALSETPEVLFAVLVGSRADGSASDNSDWDIAIQWRSGEALARIAKHEILRHRLVRLIAAPVEKIDLIDLANTRLAMRALVAEEGRLLTANDELAWAKFLTRTWRELEDYYWEQAHAA